MKILVVGDVHTRWDLLNKIINKKKPDAVLQVGDFGYWPGETYRSINSMTGKSVEKKFWDPELIKTPVPLYFCDGNHENHWALEKDTKDNNEVAPNVFYQKRGSVVNINGVNILFMGGAASIDKQHRTLGKDWFPEEEISQKDIYNLPDQDVDVIISHAAPTKMVEELDSWKSFVTEFKDSSYSALDVVLEKYNPPLWLFGHFHQSQKGVINNTKWICLNMLGPGESGNWVILDFD